MRVLVGFVFVLAVGCASGGGDSERSGIADHGNSMEGGAGASGDPMMGGVPAGPTGQGMQPLTPIEKMIMEGEECASFEQQAKNERQPVDIIWAVDSSSSMAIVLDAMVMEMNNLVDIVTAADIDVRIVMITAPWKEDVLFSEPMVGNPVMCIPAPTGSGACPDDSNPPLYTHVTQCTSDMVEGCWVGSHNALQRFQDAYPYYMDVLRPNSLKYFGVVSDDLAGDTMDFAGQASMFTAWVESQGIEDWKFFGIINPTLGQAYQMLADQTGGTTAELSVVPQDYTMIFNMLAMTVTDEVKLDCEWAIPPTPPEAGMFDKYKVNFSYVPGDGSVPPAVLHVDGVGDCGMDQGWYYDNNDEPKKVVVCPKTCATIQPDLMGKIDILFGCSTLDRPD